MTLLIIDKILYVCIEMPLQRYINQSQKFFLSHCSLNLSPHTYRVFIECSFFPALLCISMLNVFFILKSNAKTIGKKGSSNFPQEDKSSHDFLRIDFIVVGAITKDNLHFKQTMRTKITQM